MTKKLLVAASLAASVTAASTLLAAPAALAGPDDGKTVTTQSHVDAPKTYWEDGGFVLKNEARATLYSLADTVNWVGKGWGKGGRQQYIFQVPDTEAYAPMRQIAPRWYSAPGLPLRSKDPIWAGFGADDKIPTDTFRGGSFALELVDFSGPGRMEMFNTNAEQWVRILSSHEPDLRTAYLVPGSHTHNETAFTKPGRYVLTYRAIARGTDGEIISSELVPFSWQVGGTRPADEPTQPLAEQYAAAPTGETSGYSLTVQPHTEREREGDEQLTDLVFQAPAHAQGTAVFTIDGYHLAEVPVENGRAVWPEMTGSGAADYQVTFIPSGTGADTSTGSRWISAPVTYTFQDPAQTTTDTAETLPTPAEPENPAPAVDTAATYTPESLDFTVTRIPHEDETFETRVTFDDPKVRAQVKGGCYATADEEYADVPFSTVTVNGVASMVEEDIYCEDSVLKLSVLPHPMVNAEPLLDEVFGTIDPRQPASVSGSLPTTTASTPSPTPSPTPTQPAPTERVLLTNGHVDISLNAAGESVLGDDTLQHASASIDRVIDSVALGVPNSARHRVTEQEAAKLPVLGTPGDTVYLLPQNYDGTHIWPGWSTLEYRKPATLEITPRSLPEGAHVAAFTAGITGEIETYLDTSSGLGRIELPDPTHAHASWIFTKSGVYELDIAFSSDGEPLGEPQTLTFLVGTNQIKAFEQGTTDSLKSATAQPSVTPTAEPTLEPTVEPNTSEPSSTQPSVTPTSAELTVVTPTLTPDTDPSGTPTTAPGDSANGGPTLADTGISHAVALASSGLLALATGTALTLSFSRSRRAHH